MLSDQNYIWHFLWLWQVCQYKALFDFHLKIHKYLCYSNVRLWPPYHWLRADDSFGQAGVGLARRGWWVGGWMVGGEKGEQEVGVSFLYLSHQPYACMRIVFVRACCSLAPYPPHI